MGAEVGADGWADAWRDAPVVSRGILFPAESAPKVRLERYRPSADLTAFVRHYWIPRWSLPPGETHEEVLLQYATCNLVVGDDYAALFGLARGVGSRTLAGTGWAFGVMLQPGAARTLLDARGEVHAGGSGDSRDTGDATSGDAGGSGNPADASDSGNPAYAGDTGNPAEAGDSGAATRGGGPRGAPRSVASLSEAPEPLATLVTGGAELVARIRSLRDDDTGMIAAFEHWLRGLRLDAGRGAVINDVVRAVETDPELRTVEELAGRFGLGVRSLQRLTAEFVGMNPKWLLQRQRLQDAAARLRDEPRAGGASTLADLAAELGYADQAHFSRDFAQAVGMAPGEYSRRTQAESGLDVPQLRSEA
ncbi:AraC family transcriptional regulator [Herbiconiux sp. CPCC 205763]|uniref:AraC family transcriptional regulator n=1 Tax=Herbiconiux aconitum TaxID=2970913 RepID=A0ABT2GRU2_9MICO|nr:AraC family transcriptional regulator [Herbiconiux aconitum]MCS5717526.1 AraC family transcriptional regulator [Herbiconiux aconitum]